MATATFVDDSEWIVESSSSIRGMSRPPTLEEIQEAFLSMSATHATMERADSADVMLEVSSSSSEDYMHHADADIAADLMPHPSPEFIARHNPRQPDDRRATTMEHNVMVAEAMPDDEATTVVMVETLHHDDDSPATATVVETVEDCSDDDMIRRVLQEEFIASGYSTQEIEEYLQGSTLENVASVVAAGTSLEDDDESKPRATEVGATELEGGVAVATAAHEQATVLGITEHDVHPSDFTTNDVRAELIGQDYSQTSVAVPSHEPPHAAAVATAEEDDDSTEEATVLDSKPAAHGMASLWSEESTEEAMVLETSHPPEETWAELPAGDQEEVSVDGVADEEATVVITEHDVHPADLDEHEVLATLIGQDYSRAAPSPVATTAGTASAQAVRNAIPFNHASQPLFHEALAALDAMEERVWMNQPTSVGVDDNEPIILPPPRTPPLVASTTNDMSGSSTPIATAEIVNEPTGHNDNEPATFPPIPPSRTAPGSTSSHVESIHIDTDAGFQRSNSVESGPQRSGSQRAGLPTLSSMAARGTNNVVRGKNNVMERLFGDSKPSGRRVPLQGFDLNSATGSVLPRTLLPWSVFLNGATGVWVVTVNTNQKALETNNITEASKALRAFSVQTQNQADALAKAWAPPRMLPFNENPYCFICEARFAVFKRACHCRNCGVCICSNCTVHWPSKMIPDTYNTKKESMVNACKSCDWLCSAFRLALLSGQYDQAVALHATGNVNLVTPFANVKGELFYPVHCAVLGGSLKLLKWLVEDHCCPLRSIRVSGKSRDSQGSFTSILTSRGRSLLGIAMEDNTVDVIRYLVVDKNMQLSDEKDLSMVTALNTLDKVLRLLPREDVGDDGVTYASSPTAPMAFMNRGASDRSASHPPPPESCLNAQAARSDFDDCADDYDCDVNDTCSTGSVNDPCILCYSNSIDCVATPCGHQICCTQCSTNITRCPVCSGDCSFIRVFRS